MPYVNQCKLGVRSNLCQSLVHVDGGEFVERASSGLIMLMSKSDELAFCPDPVISAREVIYVNVEK